MPELPGWGYWLNTLPTAKIAVTRANAADGYPKPLTPLTQDLVITCENEGSHTFFAHTLGVIGGEDAEQPFMLAFYGLICINADLIGDCGAAMPGTSRRRILENYFGFDPDPALSEPDPPPPLHRAVVDGARVARRMVGAYRDFGPFIDRVRAKIEAARPRSQEPSGGELADWMERLFTLTGEAWELPMVGGSLSSASLDVVRRQLPGDEAERTDLCNRLHTGVGGNESAEAGLAAGRLARQAQELGLADALAGGETADQMRKRSPDFARELDATISRFGYRGVSELEVSRPSWRQDPDQLLDSARRELDAPPRDMQDAASETRVAAEHEARQSLGRVRYEALARTMRATRRVLSLRENCKIPAVAAHDEVRKLLELAGPMLVERGAIPDESALFMMPGTEIVAALRGEGGRSASEIADRREQFARCQGVALPELMFAGPEGLAKVDDSYFLGLGMRPPRDADAATDGKLSGIAAAPGTCTATARVVSDPIGPEADEFAPGEVLVASTVDPGWAPLLAVAGAIVLDIGGELSHGAMVARELGVPCVVNVKHGTATIPSGSEVLVDGSAGTVTLVSAGPLVAG